MAKIIRSIAQISRMGTSYRLRTLEPLGLKVYHSSYTIAVCECPGITQDRLAGQMYLNKSNVARQATYLEEAGYFLRSHSWEDKRAVKLYPTEKALAVLPRLYDALEDWENSLTQDLAPAEKEALAALLEKMESRGREGLEQP